MLWSVGTKIASAFTVILLGVALLAVLGFSRERNIADRIDAMHEHGVVVTEELGRAAFLIQRARSRVHKHVSAPDRDMKAQAERDIREDEKLLAETLTRIEEGLDDPARKAEVADVRQKYATYAAARDEHVMPLSRVDDRAGAIEAMTSRSGAPYEDVQDAVARMTAGVAQRSRALRDDAREEVRSGMLVSGLSFGLLALVCIATALQLSRGVSRRVAEVAAATRRVASGDEGARAPVEGGDEIAQLAGDVNAMTERLVAHAAEQRTQAAEQARLRQGLVRGVAAYGAFVGRVAAGDLRGDVPDVESEELRSLGADLATMSARLREMTLRIHEAVASLTAATSEISATTQEQGVSTAETASAVAETVSTVEEVTQSAQQGADRARAVALAARDSATASHAGREAVQRTVDAMRNVKDQVATIAERMLSLSEQGQAIGQIVGTVNELAEQSNLLALNAAIEAARAGEQGKGFAVVAHEMRALAEQSKRATVEIRSMLADVQRSTSAAVLATENGGKAVGGAVDRVREAGEQIEQLSQVIEASLEAAEQIAHATEQQVTGVGQISRAMHSIDRASTQALDGTRQAERAAKVLNELALRLREAVSQYRT
jgi:methyl-accepting chemotaxis protein